MRFSTNRPSWITRPVALRPEFVSLPYFSADTLTYRNNSSSTIFRELEKELRPAFHISDRVCNVGAASERGRERRREEERRGERGRRRRNRVTRNHLRLAIFVLRARGAKVRTETDRRPASPSNPSIRLIFYLGRGDLKLAYAFRARGYLLRAQHVARICIRGSVAH